MRSCENDSRRKTSLIGGTMTSTSRRFRGSVYRASHVRRSAGSARLRTTTAYRQESHWQLSWGRRPCRRVGEMMGKDARARRRPFRPGSGMNIYRRHERAQFRIPGRRPYLASRMAVSLIEGITIAGRHRHREALRSTIRNGRMDHDRRGRAHLAGDLFFPPSKPP